MPCKWLWTDGTVRVATQVCGSHLHPKMESLRQGKPETTMRGDIGDRAGHSQFSAIPVAALLLLFWFNTKLRGCCFKGIEELNLGVSCDSIEAFVLLSHTYFRCSFQIACTVHQMYGMLIVVDCY